MSNLRGVVQRENLPQPEGKPDVLEDGGVQGGGDLQVERFQPLVELDDHLDTVHIPDTEVGQLCDVFDEHALEEGVQVSSDGVHFDREVGGGSDLDLNLIKIDFKTISTLGNSPDPRRSPASSSIHTKTPS